VEVIVKWGTLAAILLAANAACLVADRLLLRSDRASIQLRLQQWGRRLAELQLPFLPATAAATLSRHLPTIPPPARFALFVVLASILVTTQVFPIGAYLDGFVTRYDVALFFRMFSHRQLVVLLLANAVVDLCILIGAKLLFEALSNQRHGWPVAKLVFFGCFGSYLIAEKRFGFLAAVVRGFNLHYFYVADRYLFRRQFTSESLYAAATVLPIVIYLAFLLVLLAARYVAALSLWTATRLVRVEAEKEADKIAPFSLIGVVLSAAAAIVKLVAEFV
jgi:hypothetical protein